VGLLDRTSYSPTGGITQGQPVSLSPRWGLGSLVVPGGSLARRNGCSPGGPPRGGPRWFPRVAPLGGGGFSSGIPTPGVNFSGELSSPPAGPPPGGKDPPRWGFITLGDDDSVLPPPEWTTPAGVKTLFSFGGGGPAGGGGPSWGDRSPGGGLPPGWPVEFAVTANNFSGWTTSKITEGVCSGELDENLKNCPLGGGFFSFEGVVFGGMFLDE